MLPSRKLTAAFISVFLLGAIAGALLYMNFVDLRFSNFLNRTNDPASLALRLDQRLAHDYHLSADEQQHIAPLAREMAQHLYDLRRKFASDVLATIDQTHEEIGQQMTPDQREAYQKDNEDRRKRAVAMLMPTSAPVQASAAH
jgi:uncharacterized membrane protein